MVSVTSRKGHAPATNTACSARAFMRSACAKTAPTIAVPAAKPATCKPRWEARAPAGNSRSPISIRRYRVATLPPRFQHPIAECSKISQGANRTEQFETSGITRSQRRSTGPITRSPDHPITDLKFLSITPLSSPAMVRRTGGRRARALKLSSALISRRTPTGATWKKPWPICAALAALASAPCARFRSMNSKCWCVPPATSARKRAI